MPILANALQARLIPWSQSNLADRIVVAGNHMNAASLPVGVQLAPAKMSGPRVTGMDKRIHEKVRTRIARWPEDALVEVREARLICVLAGRMKYQVSNYFIECSAGHMLFIPPGIPHSNGDRSCAAGGEQGHCELFYVLPFPNYLSCWIDRFSSRGRETDTFLFLSAHLATIYRIMVQEVMELGNVEERSTACSIELLFASLQRSVKSDEFLQVDQASQGELPDSHNGALKKGDFLIQLRAYIYAHMHGPITIEQAAKQMYQSRSQFTRRVRQATGLSFVEYLTSCRIEEAKRLLRETPWTIPTIAKAVGFKIPYFYTIFLQHAGMSPLIFRRTERE